LFDPGRGACDVARPSDGEIARGQARLKTLDEHLSHFRFLMAALQMRFPDSRAGAEKIAG